MKIRPKSQRLSQKNLLKINETRIPKIGENVACKNIPLDDVVGVDVDTVVGLVIEVDAGVDEVIGGIVQSAK